MICELRLAERVGAEELDIWLLKTVVGEGPVDELWISDWAAATELILDNISNED
jgi:hypothetical protein